MTEKEAKVERLLKADKILEPEVKLPCVKPCYISKHKVTQNIGGKSNPFHWMVDTSGYPIVNIVVQFRGEPNKPFQVQIRHFHPGSGISPTCCFVIDHKKGTLGPAGFGMAEFCGIRPLLPEVSILAVCFEEEENFGTVAATIYATVA